MSTEGRPGGADKKHRWFSELDIHAMSSLIVGGAAVLSFSSSRDLADACGFHDWLSWVWPVCLDAVAYTATRIWLSRTTDDSTRSYARFLALVGIGLSLAANGLDLFLSVEKLTPVWGVVLLVGAIPPAMLAAVIHMLVMRQGLTAHRAKKPVTPKAVAPKTTSKTTTPASPVAPEQAAELATVTQMSATAPDWLTPDMGLVAAITRYLSVHPDAKPSEIQLHIGQHLGAKSDTTRKTLGRLRAKAAESRAVGEE